MALKDYMQYATLAGGPVFVLTMLVSYVLGQAGKDLSSLSLSQWTSATSDTSRDNVNKESDGYYLAIYSALTVVSILASMVRTQPHSSPSAQCSQPTLLSLPVRSALSPLLQGGTSPGVGLTGRSIRCLTGAVGVHGVRHHARLRVRAPPFDDGGVPRAHGLLRHHAHGPHPQPLQ